MDEYELEREKGAKFVRHIKEHLKDNHLHETVVCKICGKSVDEIWDETSNPTSSDNSCKKSCGDCYYEKEMCNPCMSCKNYYYWKPKQEQAEAEQEKLEEKEGCHECEFHRQMFKNYCAHCGTKLDQPAPGPSKDGEEE